MSRSFPVSSAATALLGAFRGQPAVDRDKLTAILEAVARIAADHPGIAEIDVNPLLIRGSDPIAADALMVLSPASAEPSPAPAFTPDLEAVLAPHSVAIVGASGDVTRWGGSALKNILAGGFEGAIYPVNPKGGEFFGLPVSTGLDDLPAPPDLALLAVGARQLPDVIPQCGAAGVRAAVAIAAGFSETGDAGKEAEAELARAATDAGVTLIGPNCMGLIANATHLHATGFIALHPRPGNVAIVSQSGNLGVQLSALADRRDLGVRCFIGVGNEAQVSAVDVLDYLSSDDGTACILTYLEGIEDGRRLFDVARATSREKPMVVLRGGLTDAGGKAAASHTGAMAGSAAVYEAAARQAGLVTCTSVQEALDLTTALANLPLPVGRRVAVVTNGGGAGVLAADEMARQGLTLLEPPAELLAELDGILPPFWSRRNPFDMVATAGGDVGPRVRRRGRALPRGRRRDRALGARRAQHRRRGARAERHGRLRRLQPVGAALPGRHRRPHGRDRQAHHQRPRPPYPPGAPRRRPSLCPRRGVHAARGRVRASSAWPATRPGAPATPTPDRRTKHDSSDVGRGQGQGRRPPARDPVRQRGDRARRLGGGRALRLRLSRHAQHRDHGGAGQVRRRVRRVGAEREGGRRGGDRRGACRRPGALHDEARGPQRRRRPVLLVVA